MSENINNICDICNKAFQSKAHLKRHKNRKNACVSPNDINEYDDNDENDDNNVVDACEIIKNLISRPNFSANAIQLMQAMLNDKLLELEEANLINKKAFKCGDCGITFAHRQSFFKHNKLDRCLMKKVSADIQEIDNINIEQQPVNNTNNSNILNDSTIDNSNVHVDASITNNTTNNITNNITINIQPFGMESLAHISLKDFRYIFTDSSTLMEKLCKLVFHNDLSNISFYKYNLNKQIISFLSKNMEIERIDEKDFVIQFKKLLEDICILLFYQYREELNKEELIKYMKKLVEYQDTILYEGDGVMNKNTKSCILRLMDFAFRNKDIKYSIEKLIKELNSNLDKKNNIIIKLNNEEDKRNDVINEFYYRGRDNKTIMEENEKKLYKLRTKAKEANKKDDDERLKKQLIS
jgi:hypothetical protein